MSTGQFPPVPPSKVKPNEARASFLAMMDRQKARTPAQVVDAIAEKAANVRAAATTLGEQVETFIDYLSKVPGRVEAMASVPYPDAPEGIHEHSLVLKFHRHNKDWTLSYAEYRFEYNEDPEYPMEFKPLDQAPLKIKVAAVRMFPDLLNAVENEQVKIAADVRKASEEFAEFFAKLKPLREGK